MGKVLDVKVESDSASINVNVSSNATGTINSGSVYMDKISKNIGKCVEYIVEKLMIAFELLFYASYLH